MRPVSAKFLRTVRGSHTMVSDARVLSTFQTGVDPDGVDIDIIAGTVTSDATADIRSTLDLTTTGVGMWPSNVDSLLAPYGNEVFVRRGLKYGNGAVEMVSQGYFRIELPEQSIVPDGPIRLDCKDRMVGIIGARLLAPRQYLPSETFGAVVQDLVLDVYPGATIEWDDATYLETIGRTVIVEQDRYAGLIDVVTSRAKIVYWDHRGVLVIKNIPNPGAAVWNVNSGENGVLVAMSRSLSRAGVHNGVVATGEAPDEGSPARGVAIDDDPHSPTYFYGRFGQQPRYYSSPLLLTDASAFAAASTLLRKELGLPYSVDFTAVPNAALEVLDPVGVHYSERVGDEVHVLETISLGLLESDAMTSTTREQTLGLVGAA